MADPYRATTHNKGIMNAISAIALACGKIGEQLRLGVTPGHLWRRVLYIDDKMGKEWRRKSVGSIETPMAVGIVGGASKVHPAARQPLDSGVESAQELAGIMAAAGIAQN